MAINAADLLVNVRADVDDARRKIKAVDDDLDKLGGTFDFVGRAARAFGVAAASGFASISTGAVVSSVLALGSALAPMAGLLAALPGVAAAGGAAFATLAIGLIGVGDAFKALASGDAEKFAEAMKKLAPTAREFFRALQAAGPAFSGLRLHVQNTLFEGLGFHIDRLAKTYIPALHDPMLSIAKGFNEAARAVADFLARADVVMDVRSIFSNTGEAVKSLKNILPDLTAAFLDFATVGASLMPEFLRYLERGAESLRVWADEARRSGQIEEWIREGATAAQHFGGILVNLSQIIGTVAEAARAAFGGDGLLKSLRDATQEVENFLRSADGQAALTTFFQSLKASTEAIVPVIKELFLAFTTGLVPALSNLAVGVGPGLAIFLAALKEGLIQIQPSMLVLGEAVGTLLANLAPLVPHVADLIVKVVELTAPLIENETLVLALVAAFVSMKVIGGILGGVNAAYDLFTAKGTRALGSVIAATARWVAAVITGTASVVYSLGIVAATYARIAAQVVAKWVWMGIQAAVQAAKIAAAWVLHSATAAAKAVASMVAQAAKVVAQWVVMSVGAAANAAKIVAAWVLHSATAAATAVASMAVAAAKIVAKWVLMGVQAMIQAGRMAAAWLIAMGPVGWVIAAVVGLAALIIANWDKIKGATSRAWNAVSTAVKEAWLNIKITVAQKLAEIVTYMRELPGRIKKALGNLGGTLRSAGKDLIMGFIGGIKAMAGKVLGAVGDVIGGAKDKALGMLGIASPSKVFAEIGRWTGEGLANGITDMERAVAQAGASLAQAAIPDVSRGVGLAPAPSALTGASGAAGGGSVSVSPGAVQVIIQGNVSEGTLPQVQSSVDQAFRALLAEIKGGRVPGRVA